MGQITFSGQVPGEEVNGLVPAADEMMAEPKTLRLVVGLVDTCKIVENVDKGLRYPVIRWRHVELVDPTKVSQASAAKLLAKALENRTGNVTLPFEPGEEAPTDFAADNKFADENEGGSGGE